MIKRYKIERYNHCDEILEAEGLYFRTFFDNEGGGVIFFTGNRLSMGKYNFGDWKTITDLSVN